MEITDGEGNSLLDPETDGSLAGNGIKAIFRGETYVNDSTLLRHDFGYGTEQYGTKAYMPHFYGLVTYHYVAEDIYYLAFGELNGEEELYMGRGQCLRHGAAGRKTFPAERQRDRTSDKDRQIT